MTTKSILPRRDQASEGAGTRKGWGTGWLRLVATVGAGVAAVAVGAALGLWYLPFAAGIVVGVLTVLRRPGFAATVVTLVMLGPAAWAAVLVLRSLAGDTVGATGRTVAALAGLPPIAALTIALTLLIALLQAMVGTWLGRALSGLSTRGRRAARELERS